MRFPTGSEDNGKGDPSSAREPRSGQGLSATTIPLYAASMSGESSLNDQLPVGCTVQRKSAYASKVT